MTNRNIAIYRLVENTDTTVNETVVKQPITEPYMITVDFKPCVIDIVVAVDNDFDNGSFTVDTISDNITIKRSGNNIRLIIAPNYNDYSVDNVINFQHNVNEELLIPLLIRQTFQLYNMVLEIPDCIDRPSENRYCCNYTFSYIAKDNRPIEKREYRIRDNVFITDNESEIISENEYNGLTPAFDEVSIYQYVNINNADDVIYYEEYLLLNDEERENYTGLNYIFANDEYNEFKYCNIDDNNCNFSEDYVLYSCESEEGEVISVYEWLQLDIEPIETGVSQQYYTIRKYVKTYNNSTVMVNKPRYYYTPIEYKIVITNTQYSELNDFCKDACIPVVYEHIYNNDIELGSEEYDNLSVSSQHYYKPKWYMVRDNVDKETCIAVVSAEQYETYVIEGKYDYIQNGQVFERKITAEEYEIFPENGQNDYYVYQYICVERVEGYEYNVNDVIDFVEYEEIGLPENDTHFRIYHYGSGDFINIRLEWHNINNGKIITVEEFEQLTEEERSNYIDIVIDGEAFKIFLVIIETYEEYDSLDDAEKEEFEQVPKLTPIDIETYRSEINRYEFIPEEIITADKYNSLPSYGKKNYHPSNFIYVDDEENVSEINSEEYFEKALTRGDYVLYSVELGDNEINVEDYDALSDEEKDNYELCININYVVNQRLDKYIPKCVIPINVKCFGGSYDFVINGISKYRRSNVQSYDTDNDDNIISNYTLLNYEEYISEEPLFNLVKIKGNVFDEQDFIVNQLQMTSYGWLDSTFIEDVLDKGIFYRIKLTHKDVIGLEKTIRVVLGIDYSLNNLNVTEGDENQPDDYNSGNTDGNWNEDEGIDSSDSTQNNENVEEVEEIIPSIEVDDLVDNVLVFGVQGGIKSIKVNTVPEDSAIVFQHTSNIISNYRIDKHTVFITVPKNKYGTEQSCVCKLVNSEYPSNTVTFILKQMGYR